VQAQPIALAGNQVLAHNPAALDTAVVGIQVVRSEAVRIRVAVQVPNRARVVVRRGALDIPEAGCLRSEGLAGLAALADPAALAADLDPVAACRS